jgi:thiamine-monophosphate kinase
MAAQPLAAVVSLLLPRRAHLEMARQLYEGMIPLAAEFGLAIAGGDTNTWDGPLVINVAALGELTPRGPLRRGGAQVGDVILVTGELGGSILGHHLQFQPRVREAIRLQSEYRLHAGMDISDGLALDLSRLVAESRVGAAVELDSVPISTAARQLSQTSGRPALQHALGDGEDFELLLTVPPDEARRLLCDQPLAVHLTQIGAIVPEAGLWQIDAQGRRQPLPATGYWH